MSTQDFLGFALIAGATITGLILIAGSRPGTTLKGGVSVLRDLTTGARIVGGNDVVSPEEAITMVRQGRVSELRKTKISRWFSWGEVLKHPTALSIANLDNFRRAKQLADRLDSLRDRVGPINIDNWLRNSGSRIRHPLGWAIDVAGDKRYKAKILLAALDMGWTTGIGFSTPADPGLGHLHMDVSGQGTWQYPNINAAYPIAQMRAYARSLL